MQSMPLLDVMRLPTLLARKGWPFYALCLHDEAVALLSPRALGLVCKRVQAVAMLTRSLLACLS